MTAADREHLGKALYGLGEVFNEPVSDVKVALYFDALDDLTWAALQPACRLAVRQCRFFPRPAELRELVLGRAEDAAERAFGRLQTLVRRVGSWGAPAYDDLVLERTVQELFGSWRRCCETLPAEGPELLGVAKRFRSLYGSNQDRVVRQQLSQGSRPVLAERTS